MFTLRLVARPDARMVEVPLEIEAELPREFDGSAVLASSGLPRKVKIKAPKDMFKLSTAYRVDQLAGEVVKTAFRGTPQDVASVQSAVLKFIRAVRDRRQDGAALLVSSDGRGKIEALEQGAGGKAAAPAEAKPAEGEALAALEKRISAMEAGLVERVAQLEAKAAAMQKQIARTLAVSEVAGPGMEKMIARAPAPAAQPQLRRPTALDAFADGLRDELRGRATEALVRIRAEVERCDKAAAAAAEAQIQNGSSGPNLDRLREAAAAAAARQTALQRLSEEIELYPAAELPLALQLLQKLDGPASTAAPVSPAPAAPPSPQTGATAPAPSAPVVATPQAAKSPFGSVADDEPIRPEEAAAAAAAASKMPKIVPHDPSHHDEALAAEMALAVESEVTTRWQQHPPSRPVVEEPQGPDEVVGGGKPE